MLTGEGFPNHEAEAERRQPADLDVAEARRPGEIYHLGRCVGLTNAGGAVEPRHPVTPEPRNCPSEEPRQPVPAKIIDHDAVPGGRSKGAEQLGGPLARKMVKQQVADHEVKAAVTKRQSQSIGSHRMKIFRGCAAR